MKKIVLALAALSFATPANALTWAEFWEPFVEYSNHHHHSYDRGYHYNEDSCLPVHYDYYYYVPGYYNGRHYVKGYKRRETRTKYVNCHTHSHHHH